MRCLKQLQIDCQCARCPYLSPCLQETEGVSRMRPLGFAPFLSASSPGHILFLVQSYQLISPLGGQYCLTWFTHTYLTLGPILRHHITQLGSCHPRMRWDRDFIASDNWIVSCTVTCKRPIISLLGIGDGIAVQLIYNFHVEDISFYCKNQCMHGHCGGYSIQCMWWVKGWWRLRQRYVCCG